MRRGQDELMRQDGYVTAAEVAEAMNQTLSTIHRGIEAGRIPGGKVGSAWYVDIHAYVEKFSETGPESAIRSRLNELTKLVSKKASGKLPVSKKATAHGASKRASTASRRS